MVGQDHISSTLRNAISSGRLAHAFLLCGPRGTGKTTTARLLAKCLNCEKGPTATPCNQCDFCMRVRDNQPVMDLVEIDAASNRGIDDAKELIEGVAYAPSVEGRKKVYIIDEVHMLTREAFNALLKTLEEPPAHAVFALATTDAHRVPNTIVSRCQRFDFRRVRPADIVSRLQYVAKNEGFDLRPEAARLIAVNADGGLRDALTLLEQVSTFSAEAITEDDVRLVLGTVSQELLHAIVETVSLRDAAGVLGTIESATEAGASFSHLATDLINYCHELLLLTVGFEGSSLLTDNEKKLRHRHAHQMGRARLMQIVEALRAAEKEMRQSTDHRLLLELTLVRAATAPELLVVPAAMPSVATTAMPQAVPQMVAPQRTAPRSEARPDVRAETPVAPPVEARREAPVVTSAPPVPVEPTPVSAPVEVLAETASYTAEPEAAPVAASTEPTTAEPPVQTYDELPADYANDMPEEVQTSVPEVADAPPVELAAQPIWSPPPPKKGRRIHDLAEFVELWPAVLMRVKKKIGITAVAYLHDARPVALNDNDATLEFKKEFHYAKACDAAKRLPFEQVVNECMAKPHRLVLRLAEPPKAAPVEEEPPPPEDDDDFDGDINELSQDVHKYAQEIFAAEVVGRSGEG